MEIIMSNTIALAENFCKQFSIPGKIVSFELFGGGNINSTYLLTIDDNGTERRFISQMVNTNVFKNAEGMMKNISLVTKHVRNKIVEAGRDPKRLVLQFLETSDGVSFFYDDEHKFWRGYEFISNSITYDSTKDPTVLRNTGFAFGQFQIQLADFDASSIIETIPNFHNTRSRYADFKKAVADDIAGRAVSVKDEIEYVLSVEEKACKLVDMLHNGKLPLRVTHNDTKCNNVLFDEDSLDPISVIDLDTVMPGLAAYDFADSVRFAANTAVEDEPDESKVSFDLTLFEAYANGFISQVAKALTEDEITTLADAVFSITAEQCTRFLGDYLNGDTYFRVRRPGHNLDRSHCQIALAKDIESKLDTMREIVARIYEQYK